MTNLQQKARILRDRLSRRLDGGEIELAKAVADGLNIGVTQTREFVALCDRHADAIKAEMSREPDLEGRALLGAALAGTGGPQ